MNFGNLTLASDGKVYPSVQADAETLQLAGAGDGINTCVFNKRLWVYLGDAVKQTGSDPATYPMLSMHACNLPIADPTQGQIRTWITDSGAEAESSLTDEIKELAKQFPGWKSSNLCFHNQGTIINLGEKLFKINNLLLIYSDDTPKFFNSVYYSNDGYTFKDRNDVAIPDETDPDEALLWDWNDGDKKFQGPNFCQTLFNQNGAPVKTSSYFETVKTIAGVPIYQNYTPVSATDTLYCYAYAQDISSLTANGTYLARVKVYESGAWLTATTDPIMNGNLWEFWNGYFFSSGMTTAKIITTATEYQFGSNVQFSPHHNKFIMSRTLVDNIWIFGGNWGDWTKVEISYSDTPYGPFTGAKTLVNTDYNTYLRGVGGVSIIAIEKDKIIVAMTPSEPTATQEGNSYYNINQVGYGSYFGSVPIT